MSDLHYRCPEPNCYWSVTARDVADYEHVHVHKCPFYGESKIGWTVQLTLIEQCWAELDRLVTEIYDGTEEGPITDVTAVRHKARMSGIAFTLSKFMQPFFRTERDIAKEAKVRYDAKKEGVEHETPGLGSLRFMPPPGVSSAAVSGEEGWYPSSDGKGFTSDPNQAKRVGTGSGGVSPLANSRKGFKKLTDADKAGITAAKGAFPAAAVAALYKVPEAQVEEVWA